MDRRANWLTMKVATAIAILLCAGVKSHAQDTSAAAVKAANVAPTSEFPDALPAATFKQMTSGRKLVGMPGLTWNRQVLTVAFEGGSDPLYVLIEQTASEWTATGGALRFSFREREPNGPFRRWSSQDTEPAAAIRVSFRSDADYKGYWSVIGIMAENIDANKPTMNFDGFPEKLASTSTDRRDPFGWQVTSIQSSFTSSATLLVLLMNISTPTAKRICSWTWQ